eukprot:404601-Prorocentrum_minimum.AAC.2
MGICFGGNTSGYTPHLVGLLAGVVRRQRLCPAPPLPRAAREIRQHHPQPLFPPRPSQPRVVPLRRRNPPLRLVRPPRPGALRPRSLVRGTGPCGRGLGGHLRFLGRLAPDREGRPPPLGGMRGAGRGDGHLGGTRV